MSEKSIKIKVTAVERPSVLMVGSDTIFGEDGTILGRASITTDEYLMVSTADKKFQIDLRMLLLEIRKKAGLE